MYVLEIYQSGMLLKMRPLLTTGINITTDVSVEAGERNTDSVMEASDEPRRQVRTNIPCAMKYLTY
jgi:hypothetical protein